MYKKRNETKTNGNIYRIITSIISLMMAFLAYLYLTNETIKLVFHHTGFPDYFRVELALAKALGAFMLLVPIKGRLKEWAYAGFTITFVSAFIAHIASGDPVSNRMALGYFYLCAFTFLLYLW